MDAMRPPAPQAIGYLEAVMGAYMIVISTVVDKLIRFKSLQIGQQIHLTGLRDLLFIT